MNDLTAKIILDAPHSDVVFVFSASWFVWAGIALLLVAVIVAFMPKKEERK